MRLHEEKEDFRALISIVAREMHLPETAIERDYYIVLLLNNLANSEFKEQCVFKGGTSLSKCYPGSIERFSEDIDLTFLGMDLSDKVCDKTIKQIEKIMTVEAFTEKIGSERSARSKSMYVWFEEPENKVKLEIGSSVRPDPYSKRKIKSYIHEYLEQIGETEEIKSFELVDVELNVLAIERTFVDKLMSVKRHAICGTLNSKVRHIYDVTRLYQLPEIKAFLKNLDELKAIVQLTKTTDEFYLTKRNINEAYDPKASYEFGKWKECFTAEIKKIYEQLHQTLLYTDELQKFDEAINTFEEIDAILKSIDE